MFKQFSRITLIQRQAAGVARVKILQSKTLAFNDPKWVDVLMECGLEDLLFQRERRTCAGVSSSFDHLFGPGE